MDTDNRDTSFYIPDSVLLLGGYSGFTSRDIDGSPTLLSGDIDQDDALSLNSRVTTTEASKATLSVYDVTGKVLKVVEGEYNQGYNEVKLRSSELNAAGVLYYQLDTKTYRATKKMIVISD